MHHPTSDRGFNWIDSLPLLENEELLNPVVFLGACPQTPWVGFADFGVEMRFLRSRTALFASFSEKEERISPILYLGTLAELQDRTCQHLMVVWVSAKQN
jgi:hypothetical protein